jgi:hypothetical protein
MINSVYVAIYKEEKRKKKRLWIIIKTIVNISLHVSNT